ncbi:hypothetical protein BpHYR1_010655 [Brachionus plicatilis]|uniref:Uncharacterized protein n=1 Tax=Brachionus plicatilis TaxID=10195 RepID=A0A3M7SMA6_BRAPC|nr:hypothetical protein BpHYR1_010655 [Brachionus plicatilis]
MGKKSVTNEVRCQIIGLLEDKTKSNREIAKLVGESEKCVRTTRKNNDIYRTPNESTRPGRPRKLIYREQNSLFIQHPNPVACKNYFFFQIQTLFVLMRSQNLNFVTKNRK